MSSNYTLGEEDARRFYNETLRPQAGEWVEVRAIEYRAEGKGKTSQSWVNNVEDFVKICAYWNGQRHVYAGVNPRKQRGGASEGDVARITGIPFDVDATRPPEHKKGAATDEEIKGAEDKRNRLLDWMAKQGFTSPYIDFSGNGYRVILLVDLPATLENFEKVRRFHDAANSAIGGKLDNISDPPRIIKVPGTWAIKGQNTPERPHRLSFILSHGALTTNFEAATPTPSTPQTPEQSPAPKLDGPTTTTEIPTKLILRLRPCFRRFVEQGTRASTEDTYKTETAMRMALVEEGYSVGITDRAQLIQLFRHADDFTEEKTGYEIDRKLKEIKANGAHPYTCEAIKNNAGCLGPTCQLHNSDKQYAPSAGVTFPPSNSPKNEGDNGGGKNTPEAGTYCILPEDIDAVLSATIAEDYNNRRALFYGFLLNYSEEDQLNFAPVGPTSTGKSYLVTEVLSLFPEEDIITLGYASVKAFYHQNGYFETLEGQPLPYLDDYLKQNLEPWLKDNPKPAKGDGSKDWKDAYAAERSRVKAEWVKTPKTKVVDFHQKYLNFLDMNNMDLLSQLRPFISHDKKRIVNEITNKSSSGRNATESITLLGYPTIIFCTVSYALDGQEQTRLIQLSPEIGPKKLSESISLISRKLKDRNTYRSTLSLNEKRNAVKTLIQSIRAAGIQQIIIPDEVMAEIEARFRRDHPDESLKPEHQREYPRLIAYVKASALFNMNRRDRTAEGLLYAKLEDVDFGFELYTPFLASNEAGMPPAVYQFWTDALRPKLSFLKFLKRSEVARLYFEKFKANIGDKALKALLQLLFNAGLIVEDTHPEHGNVKVITTPDVDMEALREEAEERKKRERQAEREAAREDREEKFTHRRL